jgi:hypothetical protein
MSPTTIIAMNNTRTIHRPGCQNRAPYYALAVRLPTHIISTTSGWRGRLGGGEFRDGLHAPCLERYFRGLDNPLKSQQMRPPSERITNPLLALSSRGSASLIVGPHLLV